MAPTTAVKLFPICLFFLFSDIAAAQSRVKCPVIVNPRTQGIERGMLCFGNVRAAGRAGYREINSKRFYFTRGSDSSGAFTLHGGPKKYLFNASYSGNFISVQILRARDGAELGRLYDTSDDGFKGASTSIYVPNEGITLNVQTDSYSFIIVE